MQEQASDGGPLAYWKANGILHVKITEESGHSTIELSSECRDSFNSQHSKALSVTLQQRNCLILLTHGPPARPLPLLAGVSTSFLPGWTTKAASTQNHPNAANLRALAVLRRETTLIDGPWIFSLRRQCSCTDHTLVA